MDKLKENGFTLALAGILIGLLALGWFLVVKPWMALGDLREEISKVQTKIKKQTNKPGPNKKDSEIAEEVTALAEQSVESGTEYFNQRAGAFQLYFNEDPNEPNEGSFHPSLTDARTTLMKKYRETFGIQEDVERGLPLPKIDGLPPEAGESVHRDMKKFWILDTLVNACLDLELGGLQEVNFASKTNKSRKGPKPNFRTDHIDATIKIKMPFAKIKELLAALYSSPRVPFTELLELSFKKQSDTLLANAKILRVQEAGAEVKSFEELYPDPPVDVEIQLRALDWGGPVEEEEDDDEEDDLN